MQKEILYVVKGMESLQGQHCGWDSRLDHVALSRTPVLWLARVGLCYLPMEAISMPSNAGTLPLISYLPAIFSRRERPHVACIVPDVSFTDMLGIVPAARPVKYSLECDEAAFSLSAECGSAIAMGHHGAKLLQAAWLVS